jgi:hypothetical protein
MRLIHLVLMIILITSTMSGCFDPSGDGDEDKTLYHDTRGNSIIVQDGNRYLIDHTGTKIRLNAAISTFGPLDLTSGELNTLAVEAKGSGVLLLPHFIHPVLDGRIRNISLVLFHDDTEIELLVAPCLEVGEVRDSGEIRVIGAKDSYYAISIEDGDDPIVSGEYWFELESTFTDDVDGFNGRWVGGGSVQLERAAEYARDLFESYGLEAEIVRYATSSNLDNFVINVVAYKWGLDRDEWIVIGGHFDVACPPNGIGTWEGAYDNTAGSCAVLSLAKCFSQVETNRTMVFGLWSSEEEGLHGSRAFVNDLPQDVTVKAYVNLDMIGLAYPSPGKTVHGMVHPNDDDDLMDHPYFVSYINNSIHNILELPVDTELFYVREGGSGGSDHTSFANQGIPSVMFISGPVSHYHDPYDDLEHLIEDAGSEELLIAGVQTALWINFCTMIQLDDDRYVHP